MKITIHGSSDDLVDVLVDGKYVDEFNTYGRWKGLITDVQGNSLKVTAEFGAAGKNKADWTLGIENTASWPHNWTIQFGERPDREGDPAITFDVPEGTVVKEL